MGETKKSKIKQKSLPQQISHYLHQLLESNPDDMLAEWGIPRTGAQEIALKLYTQAAEGNTAALRELFDRAEGKVSQSATTDDTITVVVKYGSDDSP